MSRRKRKASSNNSQKQYATIYDKASYQKDEQSFQQQIKSGNLTDWSGFQRLMIHDIACNSGIIETGYIGDVKLQDAELAIKHPRQGWRILIAVSEELMRVSPHYFRLNSLYSNMALFCWGLDLYDVKDNANINTIKKMYNNLSAKLESMNLKHEFAKIMKVIPYQDIYCGLIMENQSDFFIQQINYKICKLQQVQDGLYNFIINLSAINPRKLNAYPDYVQQAYLDYREGNKNEDVVGNWYYPPADKQICVKLNCQWTFPYPLLIPLIRDILDLDVYKKLKLQSARTDNYKAIAVEVPIDSSTIDKPLLTPETLSIFAEINRESMNDDIGLIHTLGAEGKAINFKDSSNTRNNVADAVNELYNSSGETKELFNGSSSGTAVTLSVENDSGIVYGLYRQFERWVNRYIKIRKYNKTTYKFHFYLLDITIFNRDTVSSRYKDAISFGTPVIDKYLATLDMTPSRVLGSYIVHENIFDYVNKFKPLATSYTSSASGEAGRPTNADKGELLDVTGEQTADSDANIDR